MNRYADAGAFRQALEERLRQSARGEVGRLRKRLAMERLLVRLQSGDPRRWILKGGLALELRLRDQARSTRDIDLGADLAIAEARNAGATAVRIAEEIRLACEEDPGDYFRFLVPEEAEHDLEIEGVIAYRYSVIAELAGRIFDRFQLDVALESCGLAEPEEVEGSGLLTFAGLPIERFLVVPRARHLAEKLHALTRPRDVPTRVKDLVDILLLDHLGLAPTESVVEEVRSVFEGRATHAVPSKAFEPPLVWVAAFEAEAARTGLGPMTLQTAAEELTRLWNDLGLEGI